MSNEQRKTYNRLEHVPDDVREFITQLVIKYEVPVAQEFSRLIEHNNTFTCLYEEMDEDYESHGYTVFAFKRNPDGSFQFLAKTAEDDDNE